MILNEFFVPSPEGDARLEVLQESMIQQTRKDQAGAALLFPLCRAPSPTPSTIFWATTIANVGTAFVADHSLYGTTTRVTNGTSC